jgi:hypothetical protein
MLGCAMSAHVYSESRIVALGHAREKLDPVVLPSCSRAMCRSSANRAGQQMNDHAVDRWMDGVSIVSPAHKLQQIYGTVLQWRWSHLPIRIALHVLHPSTTNPTEPRGFSRGEGESNVPRPRNRSRRLSDKTF